MSVAMLTLYDDTNLDLIPADAAAVAGYVNGRFTTYPELAKRWPHAHHLSIAVTSSADADCLDVERGDATNDVVADWVKRQRARGVVKPVVYTSVSNVAALLATLARAGAHRGQVRLWTAHYTGHQHLCNPSCGFGMWTTADATQWTDKALGRSLDESVCADGFFGSAPAPHPHPQPGHPNEPGVSAAEWDWRAWRLGEGKYKQYGPADPNRRPKVPNPAPVEWKDRLITFLIARGAKAA